jgi:hypothetical protein
MYNIPDLDIDCKDRNIITSSLKCIPASKLSKQGIFPHGVGVYFCDIPKDDISGLSAIDYKSAEEDYGYVKIDLLHNSIYDKFNSRSELYEVMKQPIRWELLNDETVVSSLPHIGNYYELLKEFPKIDSIDKLAMFISIIRPGKKHLIDTVKNTNNWYSVLDEIWTKPSDNAYYYKKSHAISYATMISLLLH